MRHLILPALAVIILSSCGTQKKITATKEALAKVKQSQGNESAKLNSVKDNSEAKLAEGKINKEINFRLDNVIQRQRGQADSAKKITDMIELLMLNKKEFRKKYKTLILPSLDTLENRSKQYDERMTLYLMLEDGLNVANYKLFDLAAFFGSGKYTIPEEKVNHALESFAPIIDSLMIFSNKYNTLHRTATLVILGYADGAGFSEEGNLVDTLTSMAGKTDVSKEELNLKLSELRAKELSQILKVAFQQKSHLFQNIDNLKIEYVPVGKGEEYPFPNVKDYTIDDHRRRIVLCYWSILPD